MKKFFKKLAHFFGYNVTTHHDDFPTFVPPSFPDTLKDELSEDCLNEPVFDFVSELYPDFVPESVSELAPKPVPKPVLEPIVREPDPDKLSETFSDGMVISVERTDVTPFYDSRWTVVATKDGEVLMDAKRLEKYYDVTASRLIREVRSYLLGEQTWLEDHVYYD